MRIGHGEATFWCARTLPSSPIGRPGGGHKRGSVPRSTQGTRTLDLAVAFGPADRSEHVLPARCPGCPAIEPVLFCSRNSGGDCWPVYFRRVATLQQITSSTPYKSCTAAPFQAVNFSRSPYQEESLRMRTFRLASKAVLFPWFSHGVQI
jgi:hypothetical protein